MTAFGGSMEGTKQDEPLDDLTLRLPDGTATERQPGDVLIWHKWQGTISVRRPKVGVITSKRIAELRLPTDEKIVRQLEAELAEKESMAKCWMMFADMRFIDQNADEAMFGLNPSEVAF